MNDQILDSLLDTTLFVLIILSTCNMLVEVIYGSF